MFCGYGFPSFPSEQTSRKSYHHSLFPALPSCLGPHSLPPLQLFPTSAPPRKPLSLKSPIPSRKQHLTDTSSSSSSSTSVPCSASPGILSCVLPNSLDAPLWDAVRVLPFTIAVPGLFSQTLCSFPMSASHRHVPWAPQSPRERRY